MFSSSSKIPLTNFSAMSWNKQNWCTKRIHKTGPTKLWQKTAFNPHLNTLLKPLESHWLLCYGDHYSFQSFNLYLTSILKPPQSKWPLVKSVQRMVQWFWKSKSIVYWYYLMKQTNWKATKTRDICKTLCHRWMWFYHRYILGIFCY